MADIDYILEIVAKLRDEASPGIDALKAKIASLKATNDAENAEKDLGRAVEDRGRKEDEARRKTEAGRTEKERSRRASEDASRGTKDLARDTEDLGRKHDDAAQSAGVHTKAQEDFAFALAKVKRDSRDAGDGVDDLRLRTSKLNSAWNSFQEDLNRGSFSKGEAARGLKEFSSEFTTLSRKLETGSQDWKETEATLDRIASKLKNPDLASTGGLFRSSIRATSGSGGAGEVIESIDSKIGDLGIRISGVSSELRGFFDLAKIGFSQQLISGVVALAGGLFSVGSAAVQAGAGLAGAFISGLGQAIPMLAVVAASLERFKNILQAVSVAGQAEQQHFYDPTEKQVLQLQQTSQIISANQQLSNSYIQLFEAQQRVRDSQIQLTEARYTAQRQITELANAEKNARLEAEGATLSLAEAKRQLQIAVQKGDAAGLQQAELAVKEAELSKTKAEYEIPKAQREATLARQRGVSGAPAVISAVEGLEGARAGVKQAEQAGEAAKRQKQITELQQAARSSKETQYESQLKFLEKGMSGTELGLTNSLIGIEKELKSPDSPLKKITDYFVEPFTNAIEKIRSLLKDSSFLEPIDELAKSMGAGLGRLEKSTYGGEGTTFFEQMSRDASSNIPIVVKAIEKIMKLFEDVAKAADPAFHKLSEDWDKFWSSLDRKYEGNGLTKLEQFFNKSAEYAEHFAQLGKALFSLFEAVGHDAAPQGDKTVTSFTEAIKEATGWVQSHGPEVTKFFKEAREGLSLIGGMAFGIGKSLLEVFSLTSLKAFNGFLQEIIIPGLRDVIGTLGKVVSAVLEFFNLFGSAGHKILEVIGVDGIIVVGIVKIIGLVKDLKKAWITLTALFEEEGIVASLNPLMLALTGIGLTIAAVFGAFSSSQKKNKISTEEVTQALENQANAMRTLKDLSAEYKSSELGVKESRVAERSAQQTLVRTQKEKIVPGEGETPAEAREAHALRVQQAQQDVERSKLQREETEKRFRELPSEQRETAEKTRRETAQNVGIEEASQRQKIAAIQGRIGQARGYAKERAAGETIGGEKASPSEQRAETQAIINEEKQLAKANEELVKIKEKGAQNIKLANSEIARSNRELVAEAPKLNKSFEEAFSKFEDAVKNGASATGSGMAKIRELVDRALKHYGVTPAELSSTATSAVRSAAGAAGAASKGLKAFAAGGYIPAQSGGQIARVAEAGHDEVVLSTDPAHTDRSRALLGQYLRAAPHMAKGGAVGEFNQSYGGTHLDRLLMAIDKVSNANMPYVLGGGHSNPAVFGPLDCSGFDNYVTQQAGYKVPSTVSGNIGSWGFPSGEGLVTYFYNPEHTFMKVGGRYAGTSGFARKKDKGGAGWFEESPGSAYLSRFSTVHAPDVEGSGTWTSSAKILENYGQQLTDKGIGATARAFAAAASSAAGNVKGAIAESPAFHALIAPRIKGGGAIGQIAQGALNLATNAANIYLSKQMSGAEPAGGGTLSGGSVGREVMNFFTGHGVSKIGSSGIIGNFQQESSLDPNAQGGGLDQGQGSRDFSGRPLAGQLAGIWSELSGDEKGTLEAIQKAKTPAEAARIFSERFERPSIPDVGNREKYAEEAYKQYAVGGMVGDSVRRLAVRHLRKKILKFAQGGKAPWGGNPVPIIAHEGERIMNPAQYSETARLAGTSPGGLDRHLGYDGFPRQSFAAGGIPRVVSQSAQATSGSFSLGDINNEISAFNVLLGDPGSKESVKKIAKIFKLIKEGFTKLKSISKDNEVYANEMGEFVKSIIIESNGVLAKLKEGREVVKTKLEKGKSETQFKSVHGVGIVQRPGGEEAAQEKLTNILAKEGAGIQKETNLVSKSMQGIKKALAAAEKMATKTAAERNKRSATINALSGYYAELVTKQKELFEEMTSNVEARYQAETQALQDKITETNNAYQTISQEQTTRLTSAQALGNLGEVGKLEEQSASSAKEQIAKLEPLLAQANAIGNTELAASLKQEISSLNQTINSALVERISNAQTLIQRESAQAEAKSGERLGLSKVLSSEGKYESAGREEKAGLTEKQTNLLNTRTSEEQLKEQALREGDTAAAITLGEELNKNSVEIAENNLALKENAVITRELIVSQIEATGQFKSGVYSAATQGLEILAKTTGYTNVGGLLSAAKGREGSYKEEGSALEKQASGIGLGVEGMTPAQILTYLSSPAGQAKLAELEKGEDKAEKEQMYKLVDALETNATNTLKTAEEIAKLNGQLNQPQSWSTTAWNQFRGAFFGGMGNLLPSYSASLPPGAVPTEMPSYGEMAPGASRAAPTIGSLSLTHPVEKLDTALFGEEISHRLGTVPSMSS